jgi:hypothetical protein
MMPAALIYIAVAVLVLLAVGDPRPIIIAHHLLAKELTEVYVCASHAFLRGRRVKPN